MTWRSRSARSAATPTTRLNAPICRAMASNDQDHDRQIAPPGGASQSRPRRPRPADWCSAVRKSNCPGGGGSRASNVALVEVIDPTQSPLRSSARRPADQVRHTRRRLQRTGRQRQPVALVGHRFDRRAQFAQLAHGLPHGAARDIELARPARHRKRTSDRCSSSARSHCQRIQHPHRKLHQSRLRQTALRPSCSVRCRRRCRSIAGIAATTGSQPASRSCACCVSLRAAAAAADITSWRAPSAAVHFEHVAGESLQCCAYPAPAGRARLPVAAVDQHRALIAARPSPVRRRRCARRSTAAHWCDTPACHPVPAASNSTGS